MGQSRVVSIDGSNDVNGSKHKFGKNHFSKYRAKLKIKLSQPEIVQQEVEIIEEVKVEPVEDAKTIIYSINPIRKVEYALAPDPRMKANILTDGLVVLNYIFLDVENKGYRTAFIPRILYTTEEVVEKFFGKPFCHKLPNKIDVNSKHENLYLDRDGSIFLGNRFNPTKFELTLVDKLDRLETEFLSESFKIRT